MCVCVHACGVCVLMCSMCASFCACFYTRMLASVWMCNILPVVIATALYKHDTSLCFQ